MKTTEVSKDLIGRRCECIFTGMMVTGVIEDTEENEYSVNVKVRFDHPGLGMGAQDGRVRHAAPFAAAGGQAGLSDHDSSFR